MVALRRLQESLRRSSERSGRRRGNSTMRHIAPPRWRNRTLHASMRASAACQIGNHHRISFAIGPSRL